jgi:hypothetical protein
MWIPLMEISLARAKTRNATNTRLTTTSAFLAFWLTIPISGIKNAAARGMAIIKMGD